MNEAKRRGPVEKVWHESHFLAMALIVFSMGIALWAAKFPQSPGVCIGILAAMAGVMSLRPEMAMPERMSWIILLVVFVYLEMQAIKAGDEQSKTARDLQNQQFSQIADDLKGQYHLSLDQFDATMHNVDKVFQKTKQAANTATDAVDTMTGGEGFAYMTLEPTFIAGINQNTLSPAINIKKCKVIRNLSMRVVDYKSYQKDTDPITDFASIYSRDAILTTLGDLSGSFGVLPHNVGVNTKGVEDIDYTIWFNALNGSWSEDMHYRHKGTQVEHAIRIVRDYYTPKLNRKVILRK